MRFHTFYMVILWVTWLTLSHGYSRTYEDAQEEQRATDDYRLYDLSDRMQSLTGHKTFYELLEVDPAANRSTIATAFRKKSMTWHPDRNQNDPSAESKFALLSDAAAVLRDAESRSRYDWILNEAPVWHKSGYYVKKYMTAKLSILQVLVMAVLFISVVQLLSEVGKWLFEKYHRWEAQSRLDRMGKSENKRLEKKLGKGMELTEAMLAQAPELEDWVIANKPLPSLLANCAANLSVIRIPRQLYHLVRGKKTFADKLDRPNGGEPAHHKNIKSS